MTHTYDPFNQWIGRTVDTDGDGTAATLERTVFVHEGGQVVLQLDGTGSTDLDGNDLSHRYLWGAAVDQLLADEQIDGSTGTAGEVLWALTDHLGSVRDLVDNSGTHRKHMSYDAFGSVEIEQHYDINGNSISDSHAEAVDTIFGYTGRALDESTGLQNNLFRWFDAAVGRWASEDPIGFAAGDANLNRYVGNESTSWVDPSGLAGGGTGEPWWNDSGWDNWNPLAYSASRGDSFGNWWNPPPSNPDNGPTQLYDTGSIWRQGNIEASEGGTQFENAAVAEEEIKELVNDTTTNAVIEVATAGAGGLLGKLDDVNDLRKVGRGVSSKTPAPRVKLSRFGPKIDDIVPTKGVPRNWSRTNIENAISDYRSSIRSRRAEQRSLTSLMQVEVAIPDFTSLAKRAAKLEIALDVANRKGPVDVVVDSTGLKVFGDGEWKARRHGVSKRRTWRKLYLAVNPETQEPETQEIEAEVLTENNVHDADPVNELLEQVDAPIDAFYGDGAYDQWKVYDGLAKEEIKAIIPPRKNAKIKQHGNSSQPSLERDEAIRGIRKIGLKQWKQEIGYHRRSLAETAMYRMKGCFGATLKNRKFENQKTEARLRCKILNKFTHVGLPLFEWN